MLLPNQVVDYYSAARLSDGLPLEVVLAYWYCRTRLHFFRSELTLPLQREAGEWQESQHNAKWARQKADLALEGR